MNPRLSIRFNVSSLLLTSTALLTIAALPSASLAAPLDGPFVVAQAAAPETADKPGQPPAAAPKPKPQAPPQVKPQPPAAPPLSLIHI